MDAIAILAMAKEDLRVQLTMPDHPNTKPFIMFQCSQKWAKRYLTKRDQIM
jgi:hypothetical protein